LLYALTLGWQRAVLLDKFTEASQITKAQDAEEAKAMSEKNACT
jgi:hypothetical protein